MADILTVLAAPQAQTAGKSPNAASGQAQDGGFGGLLSARIEETTEAATTPNEAKESKGAATAPAQESEPEAAPVVEAEAAPAVQPGTESLLMMPLMLPQAGIPVAPMPVAPKAVSGAALPLVTQSLAATPAAVDGEEGQDLPLTARAPSPSEPPLRSLPGLFAATQAPAGSASASQTSQYPQDGAAGEALSASALMATAEPIVPSSVDRPPVPLPAIDQTAQAARHLGQFEQTARVPESRVQVAVDAPVRSPAFASEFSEKIVWMTGRQTQLADISLNPPQLGAIEVRLSLHGGEAGAQFFSANAAVRDAIESAMPKLREMLAQAGINLGDSHVRDEAFARRESGDAQQYGGNARRGDSEFTNVPHSVVSRSGLGLVDLYA